MKKVAGLFLLAAAGVLAVFMGWATCFGLDLVQLAPPPPGAWPMALVGGLAAVGFVLWALSLFLGSGKGSGADRSVELSSSRQAGRGPQMARDDDDQEEKGTGSDGEV